MNAVHLILFVADQGRATRFYAAALGCEPRLEAPGMTEFALVDRAVLGLMPEAGIERILPGVRARRDSAARAELYLLVEDPEACLARAVDAGAELLDPVRARSWGDRAGYCRDPDGHLVAFADRP